MSIEEATERSLELGLLSPGAPRLRLRAPPATPKHGPLFSRPSLSAPELRGSPRRQTFRRLAANSGPGRAPGPGGREGGRRGRGGGRPPGGSGEGRGPTPTGSQSRPSRHCRRRRREAEGEGRGGELRSALGTSAAVRSAPAALPAVPGSRAGVTPPRLAGGGEGGEPAAPAPPPPPRGPN